MDAEHKKPIRWAGRRTRSVLCRDAPARSVEKSEESRALYRDEAGGIADVPWCFVTRSPPSVEDSSGGARGAMDGKH
jgi:hypothetical protein